MNKRLNHKSCAYNTKYIYVYVTKKLNEFNCTEQFSLTHTLAKKMVGVYSIK